MREFFDEHQVSEPTRAKLYAFYNNTLNKALGESYNPKVEFFDASLAKALKTNIAHFSAFKETAFRKSLEEILTQDNKLLPWSKFKKEAEKVADKYNKNWLKTEYHHTVANASMAQKFNKFQSQKSLYPFLTFVAVMDGRTRESHREYNGYTAPVNDPIWQKITPPLDWGCRCDIIQSEGPEVRHEIDFSTIKPQFENNPATSGEIFKTGKPYTNSLTATEIKEAKQFAEKQTGEALHQTLKQQRKTIKEWAKTNLTNKTVKHKALDKEIYFTVKGIKEALNQPHKHIIAKNKAIKRIDTLIKKAEYIRSGIDSKGRNIKYHYLKIFINNEPSFIVIKEEEGRNTLYSITDKLK